MNEYKVCGLLQVKESQISSVARIPTSCNVGYLWVFKPKYVRHLQFGLHPSVGDWRLLRNGTKDRLLLRAERAPLSRLGEWLGQSSG